ncbi:hypothetical protein Q5H92_22735 [Hymenobacter sp. M29]|uniref:XRE family transcriptional regulator n=1 Tax=Hymenobacter mellowenesis TaxID=3063995 RepID=A0ABT9AI03_9BACT|nr:hypothetical protein [Hymenobacter sp. M29]MDO7849198.1 hypothetical protein [Hymenobacter sp. M29]
MTEKQKYYALQALVCEALPYYAAATTISAGHKASLTRLQNVKQGKAISLTDLVAMVKHSLPDFKIPAHLLPEEAAESVAA